MNQYGGVNLDADAEPGVDRTVVPPFPEWSGRLAANHAHRGAFNIYGQRFEPTANRTDVIQLARSEAKRLADVATSVGLPGDQWFSAGFDALNEAAVGTAAIAMTGHQDVIFHAGIGFKYQLINALVAASGAIGVAVSMDTDIGAAGRVEMPVAGDAVDNSSPWRTSGIARLDLCQAEGEQMFCGARLKTGAELQNTLATIHANLQGCGLDAARKRFALVAEIYQSLAGATVGDAHAIARRSAGRDRDLLPLRLSTLVRLPDVQRLLTTLVVRAADFCTLYNSELDRWRNDRNVRNAANPFPNMQRMGQRLELPMWVVDTHAGTRRKLWTQRDADGQPSLWADDDPLGTMPTETCVLDDARDNPLQIVPRGALITIVLRLLCSDLFVHGLGGQTYDAFTDELIRKLTGCEPPSFVAASESRYLFEDQRAQILILESIQSRQREIEHRPESHFDDELFPAETRQRLNELVVEKHGVVEQLRRKKGHGASAATEGKRLQQLQNEMKLQVATALARRLQPLEKMTPSMRSAICARSYPWFFFD